MEEAWNGDQTVSGWLFDLYPSKSDEMSIWIISEDGKRVKFVDRYHPSIYISGGEQDLQNLVKRIDIRQLAKTCRFTEKYVNLADKDRSKVLEIECGHRSIRKLISRVARLGYRRYRLNNVDVPIEQSYLFRNDIFPFAFLRVRSRNSELSYQLQDSVESEDYAIPPLRTSFLRVEIKRSGPIARFDDPLQTVILQKDGETEVVDKGSESDKLIELANSIRRDDPDILLTEDGDSFLMPYLWRRAIVNEVADRLILGREALSLKADQKVGSSYFSYGRVYYRAPWRRLYGRVHIDIGNSFMYPACKMDGLIEVSRTCRIPLHRATRATIGTIMMSLQLYYATKSGFLIPWRKGEPESLKTASDLMLADRGGFVFEPVVGIHENTGELDFSSLYPTLMMQKNISTETISCQCCPDSPNRVPELNYNICQRRLGIVPSVLRLILTKRSSYKRMMGEADPEWRERYDRRQGALKWVLVTCFGYLGYRNARFGKIDAHIAVCAFAREALMKAAEIARSNGFSVLHGIVDSMWLMKDAASAEDYLALCREIRSQTELPISFEGVYRWIVFLPSKVHPNAPVLNRYYGVFRDGRVKARGIDLRRGDTCNIIREAQERMIEPLAAAEDVAAFRENLPRALEVLSRYADKILSGDVRETDLIIAKRLSKSPHDYLNRTYQAVAAKQLVRAGVVISPGQTVHFLITDAENRDPTRRVRAAQLLQEDTTYDRKKYLELLARSAFNILSPFYSLAAIHKRVFGESQSTLYQSVPQIDALPFSTESRPY